MKARLLLEDGILYEGTAFGSEGGSVGEVVFNTGMTGISGIDKAASYV
jgi:carbamoyl-phosphate synthase small subunit